MPTDDAAFTSGTGGPVNDEMTSYGFDSVGFKAAPTKILPMFVKGSGVLTQTDHTYQLIKICQW